MNDRIKLAIKVLFVKEIIVVTKNEQFSTFKSSNCVQSKGRGLVEYYYE